MCVYIYIYIYIFTGTVANDNRRNRKLPTSTRAPDTQFRTKEHQLNHIRNTKLLNLSLVHRWRLCIHIYIYIYTHIHVYIIICCIIVYD